jgi:hypothetical protein
MDRIPEPVLDVVLPATDQVVVVQVVVVLVAGAAAVLLSRRRPEWRLFSIGLTILLLGLMGLRALH